VSWFPPAEDVVRARKLGKRAPRIDPRTLRLAKYLTSDLPPPPDAVDWSQDATDLGVMGNDILGDCALAAPGHMIQCWTADSGTQVIIPDAEIIAAYSAVTGYVPGDPSTDNGSVMLDVLKYWQQTGIGGHKIAAFATLDPGHEMQLKQAIYLFGGVDIGAALPLATQAQGFEWKLSISGDQGSVDPGSWGGHSVPIIGYDADGLIGISWGQRFRCSWDWWRTYTDESYAVLSQEDWADGVSGKAPSGVDFAALQVDLTAVTA
jgi:hypothetical protein